jgi:NodT family efflux transporter outer membrane factor (OMF) lipoprotein
MDIHGRRAGPNRLVQAWLVLIVLGALALAQAGCVGGIANYFHNGFKVGPNYHTPPAPLPPEWIEASNPRVSQGEPNLACWWEVFDDPVLTRLLMQAYSQNLTVRQAGIRILQAQIQRNIAATELLPQAQTLVAGYSHGMVSRNNGVAPGAGAVVTTGLSPSTVVGPIPTPSTPIAGAAPIGAPGTTTTGTSPSINAIAAGGGGGVPTPPSRFFSNVGFSMNLAWELDFWGIFRRNLEAADASLDQSVDNQDVIVVQLLANVATQYVELRTLQKRLALARQNVALQEPLVARLNQQWQAGIANSKPAYFQLKSNLENTKALIPPLEISLRQANNQLCILLGIPVRDLLPELGDGLVPDPRDSSKRIVRIPRPREETVVLTIPGETLLNRPDVRAMEEQVHIQSAQIGIAEGEMLPHIGINGNIGLAANRLKTLFNQQSLLGSIGPSLAWNIFEYGRLLANVRFQNEEYQNVVLAYQQTILNANQDVENSLVAYLQSLDQSKYLQESARAAVEVSTYYYNQLAKGYLPPAATSLSFYNQIFTAVNFQVAQQDAAAQAEGNIALNLVLIYRALGGGWQIRLQDGTCLVPGNHRGLLLHREASSSTPLPLPHPEAAPAIESLPPPQAVPLPEPAPARLAAPVPQP